MICQGLPQRHMQRLPAISRLPPMVLDLLNTAALMWDKDRSAIEFGNCGSDDTNAFAAENVDRTPMSKVRVPMLKTQESEPCEGVDSVPMSRWTAQGKVMSSYQSDGLFS